MPIASKLLITEPWADATASKPEACIEVLIWHVLGDKATSIHTMDIAQLINDKWYLAWGGEAHWVKAWRPMPDAPRWETPQE